MSQSPHDNTTWGNNRVPLPVDHIAPGQSVTFQFPVTAPSTAASYDFQWGMQREGYSSFGPGTTVAKINVAAPVDNAKVVGDTVPSSVQTSMRYNGWACIPAVSMLGVPSLEVQGRSTTTWSFGRVPA